ncbi:hypothetical protein [Halobacillus sp. B29]
MELGAISISLSVKDIYVSKSFYEKLGCNNAQTTYVIGFFPHYK